VLRPSLLFPGKCYHPFNRITSIPFYICEKIMGKGGELINTFLIKTRRLLLVFLFVFLLICPSISAQENPVNCCCDDLHDQHFTIQELQQALFNLGYYQGKITGTYNADTAKAVSAFQKETGLAIDGQVKYHLWLKLAQLTEKKAFRKKIAPPSGEVCLVIDTFRRKLIIMNDQQPYAQFPVAIGKAETPSPIGNWKIIHKATNWGTGFGTRWLGLNVPWGIYGIHGTNKPWSIGSMASHGCFRMFNKDVETIYPWIKHETPVIVLGNPFGYMAGGIQKLNVGDKCSAVTYLQEILKRKGFYQGKPDGIYGSGTEKAVKELQKKHQLEKTGQVGYQEYETLGIFNKK